MKQLTCQRYGHRWYPRKPEKPAVCPNKHCHSVKWNKAKEEAR